MRITMLLLLLSAMGASYPAGYWERREISSMMCGPTSKKLTMAQIPTREIGNDEAQARRILTGLGGQEPSLSCMRSMGRPPDMKPGGQTMLFQYWIDDPKIEEAIGKLKKISNRSLWTEDKNWHGYAAFDLTIEERWKTLKEELDRNPAIFKKAPYLKSLVEAEIARLEPGAKLVSDHKNRSPILVLLYEANK